MIEIPMMGAGSEIILAQALVVTMPSSQSRPVPKKSPRNTV